MSEMLDAYSKLNDNNVPHLGDCQLVVGDGTVKVQFTGGRAKVPAEVAHLFANHPHIDIPGLAHRAVEAVEKRVHPEPEVPVPATHEPDQGVVAAPAAEVSEAVKAAQEHLAADGEHVPAPEVAKSGVTALEPLTADGQPRCQAFKGDGSQCANAAKNGAACGLEKHKLQLAA